MRVTFDIPDKYALLFGLTGVENELKMYAALMMVKKGKISVSRGAHFAGMSIYKFIASCRENDIPVVDYSNEELRQEFEDLKKDLL